MPSSAIAEVLQPGSLLTGRYRIGARIGEGGMGLVYSATHEGLGTKVAVKVLHPKLAVDPDAHTRFLREAQLAAQLESVHCADIYDVGSDEHGGPFFVMEYLAGESLDARLARERRLDVADACTIALQALDAVAEAHHRGMVHRDLKPSNLFLSERLGGGLWTKVLDFGISKSCLTLVEHTPLPLTEPRTLLGSPEYMSPEQLRDSSTVNAAADTWALGVVLYEMLEGVVPFRAEHAADLYALILAAEPAPPRAESRWPEPLWRLVAACLAKDAPRRPSDAELATVLARYADPASQVIAERVLRFGAHADLSAAAPVPARPRKRISASVGMAIVVAAGALAFVAASAHAPRPARNTDAPSASRPEMPATPASTRPLAQRSSAALAASAPVPAPAASVAPSASVALTAAPSAKAAPRASAHGNEKAPPPRIQTAHDIELLE